MAFYPGRYPDYTLDVEAVQYCCAVHRSLSDRHDCPSHLSSALEKYRRLATSVETSKQDLHEARNQLEDALDDTGLSGIVSKLAADSDNGGFDFNDMQQVVPGVYISGFHPTNDKQKLQKAGITHICSCISVPPRYPDDFKYICLNADDHPSQDMLQYFDQTHKFISACLGSDGKVLIHCGAGISRASTVTIAFLMRQFRLSLREAYTLVKRIRPIISPNPGFWEQLQKFEKSLKRRQGLMSSPDPQS